jgi:hypothetical protein
MRLTPIHYDSSNKKDGSQRSSCRQWGLSEMAYFIFGYFSRKLGTSIDGHEKIITINEA